MKKTNLLVATFLLLLLLNSCGSLNEGLAGSKKKGSDEFLVEKKSPLVLPPSFGDLPKPEAKIDKNMILKKEGGLSLKKIIFQNSSIEEDTKNNESNNSIEESIIKKINKKKINKVELDKPKIVEEEKETNKKKGFFQKLKTKFKNLDH